jgi:hypothetical protein
LQITSVFAANFDAIHLLTITTTFWPLPLIKDTTAHMSDELKKKYVRIAATLAMAIYEDAEGLSNIHDSFGDAEHQPSQYPHLADWKINPHPWMSPVPTVFSDKCQQLATKYSIFVFPEDLTLFVVFRGTDNISNVITDLTFWQCELKWNDDMNGILVHKGFSDEYGLLRSNLLKDLKSCIQQFPDVINISFSGHSLGGAIASLAALDTSISLGLCCSLYTFGAPAVGNTKYCEFFNRVLRGKQNLFVNAVDMVPRSLDISSTISNKLDQMCKLCSKIGSSLLLVPEPYGHTSAPIVLDGLMKVSADAAKILLSESSLTQGIPSYILEAHKMKTYVVNLELSLRGYYEVVNLVGSELVQCVVDSKALQDVISTVAIPVPAPSHAPTSLLSSIGSSVSQAMGLSLLTCAVTNYHIHRVHQSLKMQVVNMEASINGHTTASADRVIGEVNSAVQSYIDHQTSELTNILKDDVDRTLLRLESMNSSLLNHVSQIAITTLENDFKLLVNNCELRLDKLLRLYDYHLQGQLIMWETEFSQLNDLVINMNATLKLVKENCLGGRAAMHEYNALFVEGRLAMAELVVRACAADGFNVCKNHLISLPALASGESYCLRVAKWIYYQGEMDVNKCMELSLLVGHLLRLDVERVQVLISDVSTQTHSSLTVYNGSSTTLAHMLTVRSQSTADALSVLLCASYSEKSAVPLATSLLKSIVQTEIHDSCSVVSTCDRVESQPPLQPDLVLDMLLRHHFEDAQFDCFLKSVFTDNLQYLREEFIYLTQRYLLSEELEIADRFAPALRRVPASLVADFYCALLNKAAPEDECECLLQCIDNTTVNVCYDTAQRAGIAGGKIFIRNYQGLYNGHYSLNDFGEVVMDGSGSFLYRSGDTYTGSWKLGRRHGFGTFQLSPLRARQDFLTLQHGVKYEGMWMNGARHGEGIRYNADGTKTLGCWDLDVLVCTLNE